MQATKMERTWKAEDTFIICPTFDMSCRHVLGSTSIPLNLFESSHEKNSPNTIFLQSYQCRENTDRDIDIQICVYLYITCTYISGHIHITYFFQRKPAEIKTQPFHLPLQ